ncbi:MAG: FAD-dependent oxidoreductase, partial [Bacteroidota bacterium]
MGKAVVIGAGFAGISAASCLAHRGWEVQLLEKNASPGGRARQYTTQGFTFDMGPSWYWMPDVFEQYFGRLVEHPENFYRLKRLDPAYRVFFGPGEQLDIPGSLSATIDLFESLESGSGARLRKFMQEAEQKYRIGMTDF